MQGAASILPIRPCPRPIPGPRPATPQARPPRSGPARLALPLQGREYGHARPRSADPQAGPARCGVPVPGPARSGVPDPVLSLRPARSGPALPELPVPSVLDSRPGGGWSACKSLSVPGPRAGRFHVRTSSTRSRPVHDAHRCPGSPDPVSRSAGQPVARSAGPPVRPGSRPVRGHRPGRSPHPGSARSEISAPPGHPDPRTTAPERQPLAPGSPVRLNLTAARPAHVRAAGPGSVDAPCRTQQARLRVRRLGHHELPVPLGAPQGDPVAERRQ